MCGCAGKEKGGREVVCGETILPDGGLVGDPKLCAKDGGEFVHWSMCSGFIAGLEGLGGRRLEEDRGPPPPAPPWDETEGEGLLAVSLGVGASVALNCGLLAVLLPPGELAVAVLLSEELCPLSVVAAAFSAFLHFARRFWNHT